MQAVLGHTKVRLHFVVQPLGTLPRVATTTPAVHCYAPFKLINAFFVKLYG